MSDKQNSERDANREELIREMFEMSLVTGYQRFFEVHFNRPDTVLSQLNPTAREAFLRDWWDSARDKMYVNFCERFSEYSMSKLLQLRKRFSWELGAIAISERFPKSVTGSRRWEDIFDAESKESWTYSHQC